MQKVKFNSEWDFWKEGQEAQKRRLDLPHDAMLEEQRDPALPKGSATGFFPGGKYYYSKTIPAGAFRDGQTVILEFEGVYMNSTVLLDGERIGGWVYGYTNYYVDLTGKLDPEKEHILTVIADNSQTPNSRWYSGSGIYRDVNLYTAGKEYILPDGIRVKTLSHAPARIEISIDSVSDEDAEIEIEVLDAAGTVVASAKGTPAQLTIPNAQLWNSEHPYLYTVRASLTCNGQTLDRSEIKTGLRTIEWSAEKGLQINGETVKLRGGCVHHDHGPLGARSFDKAELRRIRKLKELGYNAIRYSHNPTSRILLEICDREGMYVLEETFDQWKLPQSDYDYAIHFEKEWKKDVTALIRKDFNHPSVIMYCLGNEITDTGLPHGAFICKMLNDQFKTEDPTRPTTIAINPMLSVLASKMAEQKASGSGSQSVGSAEVNDIVTLLPKIMASITPQSLEALLHDLLQNVDIVGYNYGNHLYAGTHELEPNRVILSTETFPNRIAGGWKQVEENSWLIGDFMWTAWDYLGEAGVGEPTYGTSKAPFSKDYPCQNAYIGAVDLTGEPEPFAHYLSILWGHRDAPYIAVRPLNHTGEEYTLGNWRMTDAIHSWTWPGYEGKTAEVEVYCNAAEVELTQDGVSLGRMAPDACKAKFAAVYRPGTLEAVAYDSDGGIVARSSLSTAGENIRLTIRPEETAIRADGEDLAYVAVEITDDAGIRNMLSDRPIKITVTGAATLIAVGSANPRIVESYLSDKFTTYQGRMIAILRSNGQVGTIRIRAEADDLKPDYIEMNAL